MPRSPVACSGDMYCGVPSESPVCGQAIAPRLLHRERDAEVGEHRLAFLEEDVLRLDVAVDEPLAVRVVERARDLLRDRERFLDAELVLAIQLVAQRLAAHERQHVVEEAVRARPSRSA